MSIHTNPEDDTLPINLPGKDNATPGGGLTASCHCGRVTVTVPTLPTKPLNECECSVCFSYGALWAYYTQSDVLVTVAVAADERDDFGDPDLLGTVDAAVGPGKERLSVPARGVPDAQLGTERAGRADANDGGREVSRTRADVGRGLHAYLRTDNPDGSAASIAFVRCARCGCLTHWWSLESEEDAKKTGRRFRRHLQGNHTVRGSRMGVNGRMFPRDVLDTLPRRKTRC